MAKKKEITIEELKQLAEGGGNDAILMVFQAVKDLEGKWEEVLDEMKDEIKKEPGETALVEKIVNKIVGKFMLLEKGEKGEDGKPGKDGENYVLTEKDKNEIAKKVQVPVVEKIIEKTEVIKELPIVTNEIKEVAVSDTGEELVNKINSLPTDEADKKINIEHIEGLPELKKLVVDISKKSNGPQGGISGRDLFTDIDISSQLDGVTKTFNIPAVWNIISVHLSSFPHALRKNIDFTYTPTTITFTSQIDAGSTLSAGQTCVITAVIS